MSSTATPVLSHPLVDFTTRVGAALEQAQAFPAWSMTAREQASVIVALAKARAGLEEVQLRVLAAADGNDVAATTAATSTTAWLAHATTRAPGAAHADVMLAGALDTRLEATRVALASGAVDLDQARVIARAVQVLPSDATAADAGLAARAETHLLDLARTHDARKLRLLAKHLLAVLDPDAADERLGRELEAEEERAARRTSLELRDNGDGTHTAIARISTLHAAMLKKMLEAITNPAGTSPAIVPDRMGHPPRHGPRSSGTPSVTCSSGCPQTGCPSTGACPRPSSSPWTSRPWSPRSAPPASTPAS